MHSDGSVGRKPFSPSRGGAAEAHPSALPQGTMAAEGNSRALEGVAETHATEKVNANDDREDMATVDDAQDRERRCRELFGTRKKYGPFGR